MVTTDATHDIETLPIAVSHGQLVYDRCPDCGAPLHWCWRPRDYSHEYYAKCFRCGFRMWERAMAADIVQRYRETEVAA